MEQTDIKIRDLIFQDLNIISSIDSKNLLFSYIEEIKKQISNICGTDEADDCLKILYKQVHTNYPFIIIKSPFYQYYYMPDYRRKFPRATIQSYKTIHRVKKLALQEILNNLEKEIKNHREDLNRWPLR